MPATVIDAGYRLASVLILTGFAFLCQPFWMDLFTYGFPVLLTGVALFMILDHIPPKPTEAEETRNG